jgi:hypothetical protein
MIAPIDGFSVTRTEDTVILVLSNRYGQIEQYPFSKEDAHLIGTALVANSEDVWDT